MRDVRFVVVHLPGPKWAPGVPVFEQADVQAHIDHFRAVRAGMKKWCAAPINIHPTTTRDAR